MNINFNKADGLVPVIVQDAKTMQVLMLGYMNDEAFAKALTDAMKSRRPPYQKIFLVTVGSQVALFYRTGFYAHQKGLAGATPTPGRPASCEKWINIYDTKDYLGFSVLPFDDRQNGEGSMGA